MNEHSSLTKIILAWAKQDEDWQQEAEDQASEVEEELDTEAAMLEAGDATGLALWMRWTEGEFDLESFLEFSAKYVDWRAIGWQLVQDKF